MVLTSSSQSSFWQRWGVLVVACLGVFLVTLDGTMMPVALHAVVKDLKTTVSLFQAMLVLHAMTMASLYLTGGVLGDVYGRKRILMIGALFFAVGTLIATLSPTISVLILGWSLIKPIGGMMILTAALVLILLNYEEGAPRAFAFGVYGASAGLAAILGPIVLGVLEATSSWRVGIALDPILAILLLLLTTVLVKETAHTPEPFDWGGTILGVLGLGSIIIGIDMAEQFGWWEAIRPLTLGNLKISPFGLSVVPFLIMTGAIILTIFIDYEQKRMQQGKRCLFERQLFSNQQFSTGLTVEGLVNITQAGIFFMLPVVLQSGPLRFNALQTGLILLPLTATAFVASFVFARLSAIISAKYLLQFGLVLLAMGILTLDIATHKQIVVREMLPGLFLIGIGMGITNPQLSNITLSAVPADKSGPATGIEETIRESGAALGTALIGSMLIAIAFTNLADLVWQQDYIEAGRTQKQEFASELQGAFQTMTPAKELTFMSRLPVANQSQFNLEVGTAIVRSQRAVLSTMVGLTMLSLFISAFLPAKRVKP
jgi:MFS family permease